MKEIQFETGQIIICIGSGGVGKTTFAAALGAKAASLGLRVLVLTIDPSKRLATTLGIEGHSDIVKVPRQNFSGELFASVVDHKKTFDAFILRATQNAESVDKILQNKLYQQLTTNLGGSQEFTSLEKLLSAYESKEFDLIILDTPPAKHAIDFLNAPQKIAALFNEGIAKWFRDPEGEKRSFLSSLVNTGTKQVLKALEVLTGNEFIKELADFFQKIEKHQARLQSRVLSVHRLLVGPKTKFCLVTAFDHAKLIEANKIAKEIRKNGYNLEYMTVNRAHPIWFETDQQNTKAQNSKFSNDDIAQLHAKMNAYYLSKQTEIKDFTSQLGATMGCLLLPEFNTDISKLEDLKWITELIPASVNKK